MSAELPRSLEYRPALDGVRALAVLAVIAYHFTTRAHGGFLGVDAFFVLSGYLITTLLLREHAATGRIRLGAFWSRRARRLLPAVLLLVAVTAVVVARDGSVASYAERRADMLATLFYWANWHFIAAGQSYFASYVGQSPLLHAWSLAIEEQFYLVWPLALIALLWLTRGRLRPLLWSIAGAIAASTIAMATLYDAADPNRAYFGTDTRMHTLLVGAALATLAHARPAMVTSERARRLAAWAWPLVVLAAVLAALSLQEQSPAYYRGGSLLFAIVVAAGLWVLETAPRGVPARVLSVAPLRWIGAISYGLYLWHWPMLVWIGGSSRVTDPRVRQILELGATFAVATASFYLLERPVRRGRVPWLGSSPRRSALAAVLGLALVAGFAWQATSIDERSAIALEVTDVSDSNCPGERSWCARTAPRTADSAVVVVAGDSTSRALDPGMRDVARARGWRYVQAGQNACSYVALALPSGSDRAAIEGARQCVTVIPRMLREVSEAMHPDVWILSDRVLLRPIAETDGRLAAPGGARWAELVVGALEITLRDLTATGADALIVGTPPPGPPVECATEKQPPAACRDPQYSVADSNTAALNRLFQRAAAAMPGRVTYVSVSDILCPGRGHCPAALGGRLVRYDGVHYTASYSRKIVPAIIARAEQAGVSFAPHSG